MEKFISPFTEQAGGYCLRERQIFNLKPSVKPDAPTPEVGPSKKEKSL